MKAQRTLHEHELHTPTVNEMPSFSELFQRYAPFVLRSVKRLGVTDADAEDVAQEVFIVVHRRLDRLRPDANPQSWIFGILRRVVSDYRKRARRRIVQVDSNLDLRKDENDVESEVAHRQLVKLLQASLNEVSGAQREVFVLYELEGLSMQEVCQCVGCPVQTGYWRLNAARKTIQAFIVARRGEGGSR